MRVRGIALKIVTIVTVVTGSVASHVALAADQQPASAPQPGQDRPLPEIAPTPDLNFTIQAPRKSPVPRAVEEMTFDVKDVKISGATVYNLADLNGLAAPLIGKTVHLADLIAVAEQIEARYHQDGYLLTRAFVPTQSVNDGVFQITVVEGYIAAIAVQGGSEDGRERVNQLLASITQSRPLRLAVLENALLTANQLPGTQVSGLLRPSPTEPAASELVVSVTETPLYASISADNFGAQNTGRWTVGASTAFHSPLGDGGQINLDATSDPVDFEKRHSISGRYSAPLPFTDDLTYSVSGLSSHGQPGGTVSSLKLVTDSTAFGSRVAMPLIASRAEKLTLDGGFTVQSANVHALGSPFTHDEWRVADIDLAYQNNVWADGLTTASLDLSQGVPSLGASATGSADLSRPGGHTDFTKLTGQLRRNQTISGPLSASLILNGQYAFNTLLTGEEISYGGNFIGRGYDPGSITGDVGVGGAAELRYDFEVTDWSFQQLQLYGFFDSGKVWNHSGSSPHNEIASTGAGIRANALTDLTLGLQFAQILVAVPGNDQGKHTSRVMVNTSVRF